MQSGLVWNGIGSRHARALLVLLGTILAATPCPGQPALSDTPEQKLPGSVTEEAPPPRPAGTPDGAPVVGGVLSLGDALHYAIEHNPQLALVRKQRGIAQAGIVIANTYPFNPILQHFVWGDWGPTSAGITNRVFQEHTSRLDVEMLGQGGHRRTQAQAALSRTEWEIANQEVLIGIQVVRAFDTVLYRQERLRIQEEMLHLQEQVIEKVEPLVQQGHLPRSELMLARADLVDARTALGPARSQLVVAWNDLRRLLGMVDEKCTVAGSLDFPIPRLCCEVLQREAHDRRPDLHGLELAIKEAQAALRLQIANRWGNPSVGPSGEFNETSVGFVGMWLIWSPPILNTRKGECMQREADVARAVQAARSLDITIQQDVCAALRRLEAAVQLAETFRTETLPTLEGAREGLDKMFAAGDRDVTLARVIAIRLRLLQTRSAYVDALFEVCQARADLAAAVGDPTLAVSPPPAVVPTPVATK